ncbi:unnamed protein product [Plutella xylostella]|uniref:(diamondback moth) hypothetical protein n=1 Tax=Plutella xylostella TaxID=51655 RepID=A0A8S4FWM0_PLUXY|nr:unnamed protein product [Plutella xylostella]
MSFNIADGVIRLPFHQRCAMQLCCEDVISTLRKYVTVSTNTTLGSCARKMRYEDAPPQSSQNLCFLRRSKKLNNNSSSSMSSSSHIARYKITFCFHDGMSTFSEKRGHTVARPGPCGGDVAMRRAVTLRLPLCALLLLGAGCEPPTDAPDYAAQDYDERFNVSEKGMYGQFTCSPQLQHVFCDPSTGTCACDAKHPVQLGLSHGCAKPKKLGEQCFYRQTCKAFDPHSSCVQVNHNAFCQCDAGYHSTSHSRPVHRVFCTEDLVLLTADMPTLLGVASGIFVLAGLLCMVLHLYTRARFHPDHLADARLTPPCLYSLNDTGGTLSATRPSSRSSARSATTGGTLDSGCSRRVSRARGVPVSASRAGAARSAAILLISRHLKAVRRDGGAHPPKCAAKGDLDNVCCSARSPHICTRLGVRVLLHASDLACSSSSSSIRSYSAKRWEKEREQKERRQMSMRLAQLHDKMNSGRDIPKLAPTPSPRSPNNSTDGLLPAVCEIRELISKPEPSKLQGVDGPCTSSSLY